MKGLRNILVALAAGSGLFLWFHPVNAAALVRDDDKCMACHSSVKTADIAQIALRKHGTKADSRTPSCTSCHGPSERHMAASGGEHPDRLFAGPAKASAEVINNTCLNCHQADAKRSNWFGSTHQTRDVACTSCHEIHKAHDDVQDKRTQPQVCFNCHKQQRAQINKPSHHPIAEGKMSCSDCHNPHGSAGEKLMKRDTVNDTCYTCHMEKRGPFIHNHEPVSESCVNCHEPHGTVVENMLKARPPFLCHQCHTPHGPQVAQVVGQGQQLRINGNAPLVTATSTGKNGINYFMARGCLNCHTEIHGTNNPGGNPTPQFFFR